MIDAVFISDLHLHPEDKSIQNRLDAFIQWADHSVQSIYILGDFFHAWAGDDSMNEWSTNIAHQIRSLVDKGIKVYYLHGNRDFLLGSKFARESGWTLIQEPHFIDFANTKIMLCHGDRYCTKDKKHQRFRVLTRNKLFRALFLSLPLGIRQSLVNKVRDMSLNKPLMSQEEMDVVDKDVLEHMDMHSASILIHGHTHLPAKHEYSYKNKQLTRYVLCDWDDIPKVLCYDNTNGFCFYHI